MYQLKQCIPWRVGATIFIPSFAVLDDFSTVINRDLLLSGRLLS